VHSEFTGYQDRKDLAVELELTAALGGHVWSWAAVNPARPNDFSPTAKGLYDRNRSYFGYTVARSIYENGLMLRRPPAFYYHKGCEANAPQWSDSDPYYNSELVEDRYGKFQLSETFLFLLDGLATISRAKSYNDHMLAFFEGIAGGSSAFGNGWSREFQHQATTSDTWYDSHRVYAWSVNGDWTLRTYY
jgi:hypothetical protein